MALALNGKRRKLTWDDFRAFAKNLGIQDRQLENVLSRFSAVLPKAKKAVNTELFPENQKAALLSLISERAQRLGL